MRELLEVERLARQLLAEMSLSCTGVCGGVFDITRECDNEMTGEEKCPKCGTMVPYKVECNGDVEIEEDCDNTVTLEYEDDRSLLRDLRLALVQLDMARARDADQSTGAPTAVAATEAA